MPRSRASVVVLAAGAMHVASMAVIVCMSVVMRTAMVVRLRGGVVMVLMTVAVATRRVRPTFRLERCQLLGHDQVHLPQHVGQHMVGFQVQVVGLYFEL